MYVGCTMHDTHAHVNVRYRMYGVRCACKKYGARCKLAHRHTPRQSRRRSARARVAQRWRLGIEGTESTTLARPGLTAAPQPPIRGLERCSYVLSAWRGQEPAEPAPGGREAVRRHTLSRSKAGAHARWRRGCWLVGVMSCCIAKTAPSTCGGSRAARVGDECHLVAA